MSRSQKSGAPEHSRSEELNGLSDTDVSDWRALVNEGGFNPTLGPDWAALVYETVGRDLDVEVSMYRKNGHLESVIPYFRRDRKILQIPATAIELGSNIVSYHAEIASRCDPLEALDAFLGGQRNWHVFIAENIPTDSATAKAIVKYARQCGARCMSYTSSASPYLSIDSDWNGYLATRNKKFRYKLRKRKEQLAEDTALDMRWFESTLDTKELLAEILQVEASSWKADQGMAISDRRREQAYHERLLPFLADKESLLANVLYRDREPIAYNLCCVWNGWVGQLKTSFVQAYGDLSPGSIVIDAAIERAFALKAREFDFLGDADQHKLKWSRKTREHTDYFVFRRGSRGQLLGFAKALLRDRAGTSN